MDVINVSDVSFSYKIKALDNISLSVKKNEIFGLIGADGAGKTTLFKVLTTLLIQSSGVAKIMGLDNIKDYKQIREQIAYMPGKFSLYGDLSVRENLDFFASVFGTTLQENKYLINDIYCQIEPFRDRRAAKLSGGMKQKLALCCALIHAPKLLFLDEPTTGVDPVSRYEFWQMLHNLKDKGISVFVSTPYMDEAKQCDKIAFIKQGKILTCNSPAQIVASYSQKLYSVTSDRMHSLLKDIRGFASVKSCYPFGESHHFTTNEESIDTLYEHLLDMGYSNIKIDKIEPSIEDCYISLATE